MLMTPSPDLPCSGELYTRIVKIISPNPTLPPVVQEIAILPSSSHPTILYDPSCVPPAIGIPKALLLSCFLRARQIFFSHLEACQGSPPVAKWEPDAPIDKKWMSALEATAMILLWEPNHLTAINWRKRAFAEEEERIRQAELCFLNSLLTSPMPQHAKSSALWAYRFQILIRGEHDLENTWREELHVVMLAGERHAKNYHAWEHARQVWRLLNKLERNSKDETEETISLFRGSVSVVYQWCSEHPTDISGWAFLAFLLRSPPSEATRLEETMKVIEQTRDFVEKLNWEGASVRWFLKTAEEFKLKD